MRLVVCGRATLASQRVICMSIVFESKVQIRFPDCDPFRHLNNARYLDYFMNAREDHLKQNMGFDLYASMKEHGFGWVVSGHQIAYTSPATLMETVVIDSSLLEFHERDALVEMRMWDESKQVLKALLWSRFVPVDLRTGKSVPHPQAVKAIFAPVESPLPNPDMSFERRLATLRARRADEA